ncbi:MAG TPA: ATP-binding protein, partial [Polyangiaceae bacterium]|nr:ATP-binding protein [Polyangiaceae bacterium]
MLAKTNIRRNLITLAGVALAMLLLLLGALFAVQATMSAQHHLLQDVLLPLEQDMTALQGALSAAFQREADISSTTGSAEVAALRDRGAVERALTTVEVTLRDRLTQVDDDPLRARGEKLQEKIGDFLVSDDALLAAVVAAHALDAHFRSELETVQGSLQDGLLRVQDVAGRLRLAKVLLLRRMGPGTDGAKQLVGRDVFAQGDAALDLQGSMQRYAMLVAQIGTLASADALNSLLANGLPQARERVSEDIDELADLTSADPDLAPRVAVLGEHFKQIERAVTDADDSKSLASLRYAHFHERQHAQRTRSGAATSAKGLLAAADDLALQARNVADRAGRVADSRSRAIRFVSILLAVLGVAVCLFAARRIGQSIEELGATNRRLSDLKVELLDVNASVEREVVAKTAQLTANMDRFKTLVESTNAVPWEMDPVTLELTYISPQAKKIFGIDGGPGSANGPRLWEAIHPDDRARARTRLSDLARAKGMKDLDMEYRVVTKEGRQIEVRTIASFEAVSGVVDAIRGITFDVTRQKKLECELNQAQKLESVGRLASGVAHEINTPIQFVSDSIHFVREAIADLTPLIAKYRSVTQAIAREGHGGELTAGLAQAESDADLDFLLEKIPQALNRSLDGLDRVATIVRSMKAFAHPGQEETTSADLNEAIQSTLVIATNEYKYVADMETLLGDIPRVTCHLGDINQAVLNIVVNAAHAIGDVVKGTEARGRITVRTLREDASVVISVSDTGGGIPEAIRARIFDPFFTTKEVGKGTGQGLAIARSVVHEKHGGDLWCESEVGVGTTFFIRLPIEGRAAG